MQHSAEPLKTIRFEGELLPKWAQLLNVAAQVCPVSEETRRWFCRFVDSSGVDDARTIVLQCELLLTELRRRKETVLSDLARTGDDGQPTQIFAAWEYALETMMLDARSKKTCSWHLEESAQTGGNDFGDGNITLRRV
jgi:hypothetical protein